MSKAKSTHTEVKIITQTPKLIVKGNVPKMENPPPRPIKKGR